MIGKKLLHYTIVSHLGKGGMGEVFVADDARLGRQVALKVLPEELAATPERRTRFEREARTIAALNHPNIVTIFSVEEADGLHFITMELVRGRPLSAMIQRGFTLSELLDHAIVLADAVGAAHRQGITHRDLKPDNVMLDEDNRLKVLDFGLAKLREDPSAPDGATLAPTASVTAEGKILGTAAYMSPEQAEGKGADPRSDVFSLGIILYEMTTRQRPFTGDTQMSTITSILRDAPPPITDLNPSLPRHLSRIVRRCLVKNPDKRFQSARELRDELAALKDELDSGELSAAPAPTPESPRRGARVAWIVVAVLVVAVAVMGYFIVAGGLGGAAPERLVRLGTADSPTGVYYPLGEGLEEVLEREVPGLKVELATTAGSFENAHLLDRGDLDLALVQNDVAFNAVKTDRVLGHASANIAGVAVLHQEVAHVMVRSDAGIESIEDLRGRAVNLNLPDSGSRFTSEILLSHFGIGTEDIQADFLSLSDANVKLLDGSIAASFIWVGAPNPNLVEVLRSPTVRLLSIEPDLARGLNANHPFLVPGTIPARTYPEQTEPVSTVAVKALLLANASLDEDLVYEILEAIFANVPDLIAHHPRAAEISPGSAFTLEGGMSIELHPGARRFWRDKARGGI